MFLNQNASVARLSQDPTNSNKEAYAELSNLNNIRINIQPASPELTAISQGAFGKTSRAFVSVSGIQIGDRITVSGTSKQYIVNGVADWMYAPIPHLELVLFEGNN